MISFEVPIQKSREENNVVWFQDHVNNKPANFETKKSHSNQFKFEEMVINETLGFLETLERETRPIPKFYAAKSEDLIIDTKAEVTKEIDNSVNELSENQNKESPGSSNPKIPRTPKSPKSPAKRVKKQSDNNWELNTNSVNTTRKRKAPNQEMRTTKRKGTIPENEKDISNKTPNGVDKKPERKKRQYRRRQETTTSKRKNSHKLIASSTSSLSSLTSAPSSFTTSSSSSPTPEDLKYSS
ncbi:3014_t:CDS:2 [Diversispora eburnea]|uniref:3014_t:CDS:1 n=1 Tax=Diversispora eburnea TaxID=1213867 RepID=A0A9N9AB27_9GLOM|nr:3014_t:CDS:2 [Diversispora eburnea]